MGTWGTAVEADDTFQDAAGLFDHHVKRQQSVEVATSAVLDSYAEQLDDVDEGAAILFAIVDRQWTFGKVNPELLSRISADGFGLENWQDASKADLKKRQQDVKKFIERVSADNPAPKKIPKIVRRKPKFTAGDCLAYELPDGRFTAAYVLATNDTDPEHGRDLVVVVDYLGSEPPGMKPFEDRQWLYLHHGSWNGQLDCSWYGPEGFRKVAKRISVVGKLTVREEDPKTVNSFKCWEGLAYQVLYIERLNKEGA
ncbi:hypothetical protein C5Y96_26415 [Blastopirellula marina]|uniref:DUF4259 domain-containing protein n=1 Tax=Blastopirellula marina TaxID=124 RepID=A0A2S8EYV0_9BACT|nr:MULTISPECIES: hypothetical protein [Pirellulaceae]PQO25041.1 hypothetical protein C5Y96_26415 [Blastopirellula marina]RCS40893.1 hypothetical protein DTL36_26465 [Bremerella cremea]